MRILKFVLIIFLLVFLLNTDILAESILSTLAGHTPTYNKIKYITKKIGKSSTNPADREARIGIEYIKCKLKNILSKGYSITKDDKIYLSNIGERFNFLCDSIKDCSDGQSLYQYCLSLYYLIEAEEVSKGFKDIESFDISDMANILDPNFIHELHHIYDDIFGYVLFINYEFQDYEFDKGSDYDRLKNEFKKIENNFTGIYRDEDLAWRSILSGIKGLKILDSKMALAIIDGFLAYMERARSRRMEVNMFIEKNAGLIIKFLQDHNVMVDKNAIDEYRSSFKFCEGKYNENLSIVNMTRENIARGGNSISLIDLNRSIIDALRPYEDSGDCEIRLNLSGYVPKLSGNIFKIKYIWLNLFRNSFEAMRDAKTENKLFKMETNLITYKNRDWIEIIASDNGPGISGDLLKDGNLFKRGVTTKELGTGQGLYLIKETVNNMGGHIEVESEKGHGARFIIRLPLNPGQVIQFNKICDKYASRIPCELADFYYNLADLLGTGEIIFLQNIATLIFSERLAFDEGLSVLLPKLALSGVKRVAVIATSEDRKVFIERLNEKMPHDRKIICADNIDGIKSAANTSRYIYFKLDGDFEPGPYDHVISLDVAGILPLMIKELVKIHTIDELKKIKTDRALILQFIKSA